jgi:AcrR family transcriptional regulator
MSSDPWKDAWDEQPERPERPTVDRTAIVRAALEVADADGPDAVSMRRVASHLGVGTMTLYHYVDSKDDLLALMGDLVMAELYVSDLAADWRQALRQIAVATRAVYLRHPWLASHHGRRPEGIGPNAMRHFEQSLEAVSQLDVTPGQRAAMMGAVDDFTIGFTTRELAFADDLRRRGESEEEWRATIEERVRPALESGRFPQIARFLEEGGRPPRGRSFEEALDWLLEGMAASLATGP